MVRVRCQMKGAATRAETENVNNCEDDESVCWRKVTEDVLLVVMVVFRVPALVSLT